ncbi:condensation domain-containing protein [Bradyrhizobium cenepequi]|uniref:condensation domain-containing protein n=1 Tax=Bradyrhizobium cenepequi TaxID=2821403 RepID=UPI001CE27693|nr:condensation domain-containing protein [Bradyrhizobium cenepequi]MCA6111542.1 hypothetical protein [Bradyrhizobium cenepequi]
MERARLIQINAVDSPLLSAVSPIEALPRPSRVSLFYAQQRRWFRSRLDGGSETCQIQMGRRLRGELDESSLQPAFGLVVRHEVLRNTVAIDDNEPFQQIGPEEVGLALNRNARTPGADAQAKLSQLVRQKQELTSRQVWGEPMALLSVNSFQVSWLGRTDLATSHSCQCIKFVRP